MKNKTPLRELMEAIYDLPPLAPYQWMEDNKERLLKDEREMVKEAWAQGNAEGGGCDPGVPEDGYTYYDENYGKSL